MKQMYHLCVLKRECDLKRINESTKGHDKRKGHIPKTKISATGNLLLFNLSTGKWA